MVMVNLVYLEVLVVAEEEEVVNLEEQETHLLSVLLKVNLEV